ncbi:hypothetical protein D1610_01440 [Sphingomonas gilva]|uniref:Terminase n=1 Tax=Sphingomonas gilva TaxID=2305907 RepID=A0A396RTU8_9SPHN|nr:hypothetical protein [Sphingomonas gilva]RHW18842.1 hypothetical protein D1610_01440 [Sphingomonas gilva]
MTIKPQEARALAARIADDGLGDGDPKGGKKRPKFVAKRQQLFLDALALTCNVKKAAAFAGVDKTTPYLRRRTDPVFAAQWQEAIEIGYDRLEALLLEYGGAGVPLEPADADRAIAGGADGAVPDEAPPPFDFERALAVLKQYWSRRQRLPFNRGGRPRRNATREETNAALIKALAAAQKRLAWRSADGE